MREDARGYYATQMLPVRCPTTLR